MATPPPESRAGPARQAGPKRVPGPNLAALLAELDRPLEDIDWRNADAPRGSEKVRDGGLLARMRRERRHRRELRRAREAATRAFGVRPRLSARKRATLMLSSGAVGLAAFTAPVAPHEPARSATEFAEKAGRKSAWLLRASKRFKLALREEEGVRYTVYRDVAGYPTVGVGHLVTPADDLHVGDRVNEAQVARFLDRDLATAESGVRDLVGDLPLHQHEFDALLDLVYNVGGGNVDEGASPRLNAAIEARDYDAIADELEYTKACGERARGLENRSDRREAIFLDASYEDPRNG